jgi:hypothetical protein
VEENGRKSALASRYDVVALERGHSENHHRNSHVYAIRDVCNTIYGFSQELGFAAITASTA